MSTPTVTPFLADTLVTTTSQPFVTNTNITPFMHTAEATGEWKPIEEPKKEPWKELTEEEKERRLTYTPHYGNEQEQQEEEKDDHQNVLNQMLATFGHNLSQVLEYIPDQEKSNANEPSKSTNPTTNSTNKHKRMTRKRQWNWSQTRLLQVGDEISVYWPDDERYYDGVIQHKHENGLYSIRYDDNEEELLDLTDPRETWRLRGSAANRQAQQHLSIGQSI